MSQNAPPQSPRLGDLLVSANAITKEQLQRALAEQSSWGGRLGQNLLTMGFIEEATLVRALAEHLGLPVIDLDAATVPATVTHLLPLVVAERYGLVPIAVLDSPKTLVVACADPTNEEALRTARLACGLPLELRVCSASAIERALRRFYYGEAASPSATGDPRFNVTHHSRDPAAAPPELEERVAELERKLEALTQAVARLSADDSR